MVAINKINLTTGDREAIIRAIICRDCLPNMKLLETRVRCLAKLRYLTIPRPMD
jgi:hypothetical protein